MMASIPVANSDDSEPITSYDHEDIQPIDNAAVRLSSYSPFSAFPGLVVHRVGCGAIPSPSGLAKLAYDADCIIANAPMTAPMLGVARELQTLTIFFLHFEAPLSDVYVGRQVSFRHALPLSCPTRAQLRTVAQSSHKVK